ncbi:MAG: hypothetical protein Fur0018_26540 [Anaerolineales bacterium]
MGTLYQQLLTLLTTPPGNLAYHLVMAFSIAWALQSALTFWRLQASPQSRRLLFGLGALLVLRILLFAGAVVASQGWLASPILLPALDRLVTILGLTFIIWMWVYPEPLRMADFSALFAGAFAVLVFLLNLTWGNPGDSVYAFNQTGFDLGWEVLALAGLVVGCFLLILRRPNQWGIGLGMLGISILGHLAHLISPQANSDLPGAVRLAQLTAYPLLLSLPQRFVGVQPQENRQWQVRTRQQIKTTLEDWFALQSDLPLEKRVRLLARFLAHSFDADTAAILKPTGQNAWEIISCYNQAEDAYTEGGQLVQNAIPILHNALHRNRPLRLPASSTSVDLRTLWQTLHTPGGHLLAAPVVASGTLRYGILLLSDAQTWSQESQGLLWQVGQSLGREDARQEMLQTLHTQLEHTQATLKAAEQSQHELKSKLEILQDAAQKSPDLDALLAAQDSAQKAIAQLEHENQELKKQLESAIAQPHSGNGQATQLEQELRTALSEVAHLQQLLSEADRRALLAKKSEPVTDSQRQALINLSQELRQPMSSILGYTDLLLGESVGILGALQRKFLERIHASIERMGTLIEDLIQIVTVGKMPEGQAHQPIALSKVIDHALASTGSLMREKNIALRIDLPQDLPVISADQNSLHQALIHLLKNAASATPINGEVTFNVRLEREASGEPGFVLLQISDQGGGIHVDDMPRIFSRLYHSENTPIPGLGDNGTGLALTKTLIENQGGRVWADSQPGSGTTFSVLLPLAEKKTHSTTTAQ